ncbi:MAG: hypothetical protein ABEI99_01625 [Halobaculum sp.]
MSETVRVRDDDYEQMRAAQEVLGLPFPEVVHLSLTTDLLDGSPAQNARRAIQNYQTYILMEYDDPHEVPVEEFEFDSADQVKTAVTIGAEKRERRLAEADAEEA